MPDNFTQPEPQYGELARMQQLTAEAPISGAPLPGAGAPSSPAAPTIAPPGPVALAPVAPAPHPNLAYYEQVARFWTKMARGPHVTPTIKEQARLARAYLKRAQRGEV